MNRSIGLVLAAVAAIALAAPSRAAAQVDFGVGLGARISSVDLNTVGSGATGGSLATGGIEGTVWFNDMIALDFGTYLGVVAADGGDARFDLGLWAGVLVALLQFDQTKFELGARLGLAAAINTTFVPNADDDDALVNGEVLIRIEHWFDDHFTLSGLVGLAIAGDPDDAVGFSAALGAQAGLVVTCYTGGTAAPGDGSASPVPDEDDASPAPARTYAPAPAPAPADAPPPDPESGAAGW